MEKVATSRSVRGIHIATRHALDDAMSGCQDIGIAALYTIAENISSLPLSRDGETDVS